MKIGIVCPGQMGDVAESTGLFKYRRELWGMDPEIHWFVRPGYEKALLRNPHVTVHLVDGTSEEVVNQAHEIAFKGHYDAVYHTAPWLNWEDVDKIPLPMIPAKVLKLDLKKRSWRPEIYLTEVELAQAREFMLNCPPGVLVFFETACFSHQAEWTDEMTKELARRLPRATFLCASFGYAEQMMGMGIKRAVGLDALGFRQLTEVYNFCDAFVGVPSGAASITCAYRCRTLPRVEYLAKAKCPGWGTTSMMPGFAHWDPKIVLDRAVHEVHNLPDTKQRRADKRRWRHVRRGIIRAEAG